MQSIVSTDHVLRITRNKSANINVIRNPIACKSQDSFK